MNDKHIYNSASSGRSNASAQGSKNTRSLHQGKVVELLEGHRMRVRIDGLDNRFSDNTLPICFSLLPLFIKVNPEIGELVDVLLCDTATPYDDRRWIGPTLTQYNYFAGQPLLAAGATTNRDGFYKTSERDNPRKNIVSGDLFSDENNSKEQVWTGRENTDITQKPNQVRIRVGKHLKDKPLVKNRQNPATVAVHVSQDGKTTTVAAVADQFVFLGHNGDEIVPQTRLGEINDDVLTEMVKNSHPATLTNHLIQYLSLQRQVFMLHTHGYDGSAPVMDALLKKLEEFDLSLIASKTMRLN